MCQLCCTMEELSSPPWKWLVFWVACVVDLLDWLIASLAYLWNDFSITISVSSLLLAVTLSMYNYVCYTLWFNARLVSVVTAVLTPNTNVTCTMFEPFPICNHCSASWRLVILYESKLCVDTMVLRAVNAHLFRTLLTWLSRGSSASSCSSLGSVGISVVLYQQVAVHAQRH